MSGPTAKDLWHRAEAERDKARRQSNQDKPTARELLDKVRPLSFVAVQELASRVEKVLALHHSQDDHAEREPYCGFCGEQWPCRTVRILNGEEP